MRIELAGLDRVLDCPGRALQRLDRLVQSLDAGLDQSRRLRHAALQPAGDREKQRKDRAVAGQMMTRFPDVGGDLFPVHHRLPAGRQCLLLARLDGEARQFLMGVPREFGLGLRGRDPGPLRLERPLRLAQAP